MIWAEIDNPAQINLSSLLFRCELSSRLNWLASAWHLFCKKKKMFQPWMKWLNEHATRKVYNANPDKVIKLSKAKISWDKKNIINKYMQHESLSNTICILISELNISGSKILLYFHCVYLNEMVLHMHNNVTGTCII